VTGRSLMRLTRYTVLALAVFGTLLPLYWLFVLSTRPAADAFSGPKLFVKPDFGAYGEVWASHDFRDAMWMSSKVVLLSIVITLLVAIPAAYSWTRFQVRGQRYVMAWLLLAYLLPEFLLAIPLYAIYQNVHLYDTAFGLAFTYQVFMVPLAVWLLLRFFAEVPLDLAEAAHMDGCSNFQVLIKIYIPLVGPGIATTAILAAIWVWNEVSLALALTFNHPTVPIAVASYRGYAAIKWDQMTAAAIIGIIPVLILALFVQRQIVRGLTAGTGK
jgi:ABC-type glycerol-3-phosphate transport system permease component